MPRDGLLRSARNDGEALLKRHSPRHTCREGGYPVRRGLSILSLTVSGILDHPPCELRTRRVTTTECASAFSRRMAPEACMNLPLPQQEEQECRVLAAPAVCVQCRRECAHEHTGTAGALRHSLRNGLTAYAVLSLETNSSCLHRCRLDDASIRLDRIRHRQLGTSHGCRGPHGFAVRVSAGTSCALCSLTDNRPANTLSRLTLPRPPHPARVRDDGELAPLAGPRRRQL